MDRLEKLLIFRVGPAVCCVTSNSVETIMRPPEKETHGKEGNLPEIFRHGGRIARTVDVRKKFGLSAAKNAADGNIILSKTDKGLFAFWVDQIINVIDADEGKWGMLPPKLPRDVFSATFMLNDEIILFTDFSNIEQMRPSAGLTEHLEKLAQDRAVQEAEVAETKPVTAVEPEKEPEPKPTLKAEETVTSKPEISQPEPAPARPKPEPFKVPERPKVAVSSTTEPRPTPKPSIEPARPTAAATVASTTSKLEENTAQIRRQRDADSSTEVWGAKATTAPKPEPMPKAEPPPRNERVYEDDEDEEGSWLFPAFILLMLVGIIGGGWYFYSSINTTPSSYARVEDQAPEPEIVTAEVEQNPVDTLQLNDEPAGEAVLPTLDDTAADESYDTPAVEEPVVTETPPVEETTTEEYSATIEKEDNVVTITLDSPNGDALKEPETTATEETAETTTAAETTAEEGPQTTVAEEKPAEQQVSEPKVITHVVVKGDTLWDIAEKYVKDPYKYPELAKYSNIKNPDLIYPGDIVRIQTK